MRRREVLRLLGRVSVFSVLSADWLARSVRAQAAQRTAGALQTLTPAQNDIVVAMSAVILPATDTPGAKDAGVNEFIDLILSAWATDDERAVFLTGLAEADRRSNELFGRGFAAASIKEQTAIVRAFDDELAASHNDEVVSEWTAPWEIPKALPFFDQMRKLTLTGYYTSTIGQERELKVRVIPGVLHGCVPEGSEVEQ